MEALVPCNTSLFLPWFDVHKGLVTLCGFNCPEAIDIEDSKKGSSRPLDCMVFILAFFFFNQLKKIFYSYLECFHLLTCAFPDFDGSVTYQGLL